MTARFMMAGQDISAHVDEATVNIKDTLGQGAGTTKTMTGRAATAEFHTDFGPAYKAARAGSRITSPQLVRMGEVQVYDTNGALIYGGYATKLNDETVGTKNYTKVECTDYWQHLDRVVVNEVYDGQTDVYMIKNLCQKYANWIDLSQMPSTPVFTFGTRNFRHYTLQKCLTDITDVTGYQIWLGYDKKLHYTSPANATLTPFGLADQPDFLSFFPCRISKIELDDTAAVNRVFFYGGKQPSGDFTQDVSTQANGSNTTFTLAYYPHAATDGKVHVYVNSVEQVVGRALGTGNANKLKSAGGSADVLLNADAQVLIFSTAPATGAVVTCKYRYQTPLVVVATDTTSVSLYGQYLDAVISDKTVFNKSTGVQRAKVLLLEASRGLTTIEICCWKPGIYAGMNIPIRHNVCGLNDKFVVQEVEVTSEGSGVFRYHITCGAYNWNLVDAILQSAKMAQPPDENTDDTTIPLTVSTNYPQIIAHTALTKKALSNYGGYCAHASVLGDGHDAYCGFCSISS